MSPTASDSKSERSAVPIIVDFEASGIASASYPIEVGVALDDGQRYCDLIKPAREWTHWDRQAESVHGISRQHLYDAGRSPRYVAEKLNQMLANRTAYCDAWVLDYPWLRTLFWAAQLETTFWLSPLELILKPHQLPGWHAIKQRIADEIGEQRHRASVDALVIQMTYVETAKRGSVVSSASTSAPD